MTEEKEPRKIWYKLRGALIVPFFLVAILYDGCDVTMNAGLYILGALLFLLGWGLRIWAQIHLHYRLKAHKQMTSTGPYVYVRNPIYWGNTFILLGITVLAGFLWWLPAMFLACAFTYHMTVLYEEGHLTRKYGAPYVEFLGRIPRWIPSFKGKAYVKTDNFKLYFWDSIKAELHMLALLLLWVIAELVKSMF